MENISNNLYYNEEYNYLDKDKDKDKGKFIGIPITIVDVLLDLKSKELNIFQEIVLKMCQCGQYEIEEIKDILSLDDSLIEYIKIELEHQGYTENQTITRKGKEALKDKISDVDKKIARLYFNHITGSYFNYIDVEFNIAKKNEHPVTRYLMEKTKIAINKVNIGTTGSPKEISIVKFKGNENRDKLEINNFFRIRDNTIYSLKTAKSNLSKKERIQNLKDIVKFEVLGVNEFNYLLSYIDNKGNIYSPFQKSKKYYSEEFRKEVYIHDKIKQFLNLENELNYIPSYREKEENEKNINSQINKIIELSDNKLKGKTELVDLLKEFYFLEEIKDQKTYISSIYKTFVAALWEYYKELGVELDQYNYTNFQNKLIRLLNIEFNLELDSHLFKYYSKMYKGHMKFSQSGEVLKNSLVSLLLLEIESSSNKLFNFVKTNINFLQDMERLKRLRDEVDHNGQNSEDLHQGDLIEYKELIIKFIEHIFSFSFKRKEELQNNVNFEKNLRKKVKNELMLNYNELYESKFRKELLEIQFRYGRFELGHKASKDMILKEIGVLFEKNLKELGEYIVKKNIDLLPKKDKFTIKDLATRFFKNSIKNLDLNKINDEFNLDNLQEVSFERKKIEQTFYAYKRGNGTLNTYSTVLLYSTINSESFLNRLLKELPEFFKACFVISKHRGHSGKTDMDVDELGEFIKNIYKVQEKYIELKGE